MIYKVHMTRRNEEENKKVKEEEKKIINAPTHQASRTFGNFLSAGFGEFAGVVLEFEKGSARRQTRQKWRKG
jgi:hypothetical protein